MSTDKNQLLRELLGEREAILTALNYSYIVASGASQARFQTYTGPGGVLLRIDSSELEYTLSNPSQLVTHYTPDVIEKANVNLIRITMRNAITQLPIATIMEPGSEGDRHPHGATRSPG